MLVDVISAQVVGTCYLVFMYISLSSNQANFNKTIIFSLVVHFIILSILFYSAGSPRRLSLPPVYTVNILPPSPHIESRPAVKKQSYPAEKIQREAVTKKPAIEPPVKKEKNIVGKGEVNEKLIKEPLKQTVKAVPPIQKSEKAATKESDTIRTEEIKPKEAFTDLKETDITQTQDLNKGIAELEAKLRMKESELKIKSALKKFKKSTTLEDETNDSSSARKDPLQNLDRESHTLSTIQEDIDKLSREKNLNDREHSIREAFRRAKEKEKTISQDVKELVQKTEGSDVPEYKPREWSFEFKGEKGLSAKFRIGEISDEEASSIAKIIAERIESVWRVDEFLARQRDYSTLKSVVSIKVGVNGNITDIIEEQKSENHVFHRSVLAAIKESDPLPLKELNIRGGFEIGLTFSPINAN